jgi:PEP-CTERM motif
MTAGLTGPGPLDSVQTTKHPGVKMRKSFQAGRHVAQCAALALTATTALQAGAADALYTSQAAFVADTAAATTESFESLAGTSRGLASIVTPLLTLSTTVTPIGVQTAADSPESGFGAFATDGTHYVSVYRPSTTQGSITFTLPGPSTAFGLALTDIGEASGTVTLTTNAGAYASGGVVLSFPPLSASGATHFAGLTQDLPFSVVTLTVTGLDEAYGLDAVRVMAAVPEPGSALTLLAGLAGLAGLARRRQ